ncbi:MAG: DUF2993 domain-containing protein [Acidobacteria bacterium]|nr:DUF2993 domain-containing protein [Acidobacteriota bacterium]
MRALGFLAGSSGLAARRLLIRLGVTLGVLGVLFAGANVAAERLAEDRLAALAQDSFDLRARPEVALDAFPILVRIFAGDLPAVSLRASGIRAQGLTLRSVAIELQGIRFPGGILGLLSNPERARVIVARGRASAEVGEKDLNRFLAGKKVGASVRLLDGRAVLRARRVVGGRSRVIEATGRIRLGRGAIFFDAEKVTVDGRAPPASWRAEARRAASFRVDLPKLPGGLRVQRLEILRGAIRLSATVRDYEMRLRPPAAKPGSKPGSKPSSRG